MAEGEVENNLNTTRRNQTSGCRCNIPGHGLPVMHPVTPILCGKNHQGHGQPYPMDASGNRWNYEFAKRGERPTWTECS